jgi:hypothetical protein
MLLVIQWKKICGLCCMIWGILVSQWGVRKCCEWWSVYTNVLPSKAATLNTGHCLQYITLPICWGLKKPTVEILNSHWLNCHKTILYNQNVFLYFIFSVSTFTSSVTLKVKAVLFLWCAWTCNHYMVWKPERPS